MTQMPDAPKQGSPPFKKEEEEEEEEEEKEEEEQTLRRLAFKCKIETNRVSYDS